MLPGIVALGLIGLLAIRLSVVRNASPSLLPARRSASLAMAAMVVVQTIHFAEELQTGFHSEFGPVFGQPPMPLAVFVIVNVSFIVIWILSIPGLRRGRIIAFGAAWFLGLAGVLNGVAHPVLALIQGGYFPGLYSSPIVLVAGCVLLQKLKKATVSRKSMHSKAL